MGWRRRRGNTCSLERGEDRYNSDGTIRIIRSVAKKANMIPHPNPARYARIKPATSCMCPTGEARPCWPLCKPPSHTVGSRCTPYRSLGKGKDWDTHESGECSFLLLLFLISTRPQRMNRAMFLFCDGGASALHFLNSDEQMISYLSHQMSHVSKVLADRVGLANGLRMTINNSALSRLPFVEARVAYMEGNVICRVVQGHRPGR